MYQARFQTLDLSQHICSKCGFFRISDGRAVLLRSQGKRMLCMPCGDAEAHKESKRKASMVQIPYSKGAYQYIHNPADLRTTNPKRTT
jgi:hypothetical protein